MRLKTRRLVFGTLAGLLFICTLALWIAAAWTDDPLSARLGATGAIMLIPEFIFTLACVPWKEF